MQDDRTDLIQRFRQLSALEHDAYRLYKSLLPYITDPEDRTMLEGIMRDEQRHAEMAAEVVHIIEGAAQS